jgi:hypothetical protein
LLFDVERDDAALVIGSFGVVVLVREITFKYTPAQDRIDCTFRLLTGWEYGEAKLIWPGSQSSVGFEPV